MYSIEQVAKELAELDEFETLQFLWPPPPPTSGADQQRILEKRKKVRQTYAEIISMLKAAYVPSRDNLIGTRFSNNEIIIVLTPRGHFAAETLTQYVKGK